LFTDLKRVLDRLDLEHVLALHELVGRPVGQTRIQPDVLLLNNEEDIQLITFYGSTAFDRIPFGRQAFG
jgi:hypothetical protein